MLLRSIIVDDEKLSRDLLHASLEEYCSGIEVGGEAASIEEARPLIEQYEPDVVFLDIQMPNGSGFDLVADNRKFEVVFVTAYRQFAIHALKAGAVDYLLKPIDTAELKSSVERLYSRHAKNKKRDYFLFPGELDKRISIRHTGGFRVLQLSEITRLEASDNYTRIHLTGGTRLTVCKTLKDFERKLHTDWFLRVHKSYMINLFHLREYLTEDGGVALMSDGEKVPVSRFSMQEIFDHVQRFSTGS